MSRAAGRGVVVLLLGAGAALVHRSANPGVLCTLLRLTGVPCPLCGSTTVLIDLGSGRPGAAVAANPVTATVLLGLVLAPLRERLAPATPRGRFGRWRPLRGRRLAVVLTLVLLASEMWQLHRFGLLASGPLPW